MRHQGALARQERYRDLDCLAVPVLGVASRVDVLAEHLLQLVQEAELGAHAEVRYSQEAQLHAGVNR